MMKRISNQSQMLSTKRSQTGAILLEALIAIVIFSMGILAVAGLQATMIRNTTDANFRAEAAFIAQQVIGQMWADPKNIDNSVSEKDNDGASIPSPISGLPNGQLIVERPNENEQVRVTVSWQMEGGEKHQVVTNARITGDVL
jgi:type IV pilus assembly protein PilV